MRDKFPLSSWSRDPFFQGQNNSAIGPFANIDQHKILIPMVHNTVDSLWSRDPFLKVNN